MRWRLSLAAFVLFSGGLAYATFDDVNRLTRLTTPTPPEVAQDWIVRKARDEEGRTASFRILLFTDDFKWELSSYASVEEHGSAPEFTPQMKAVLNRAVEIICIGASSEETAPGLEAAEARAKEERRAARRAERIAAWVEKAINRPVPVRKLNAGYHLPTGAADTSDQRRVVIVLVLEREGEADLDQALRDAMLREREQAPIFDVLLTRYSLTRGRGFSWVE